MSSKEVRQLIRWAERRGWDVTYRKAGHYRLTRGDKLMFMPGTPSDVRAVANARATILRLERAS